MNSSRIQSHDTDRANEGRDTGAESSRPGLLPFQPLVETWDMLSAATIVRLRWTAARFSADGLVPLALQGILEPRTCGWLAHR